MSERGESTPTSFNIQTVITHFRNSLDGERDDIQVREYVLAYDELRRLFKELGMLFSFVESDVLDKCGILRQLHNDNADAYSTVKSMVNHETNNGTIRPQGARTFLRLHRALEFLSYFVEKVHNSEDNVSVPEVFRTSYGQTLANYHGWLIRKSIGLASNTVPDKEQLIKIIFKNSDNDIDSTAIEFLEAVKSVYEKVQDIYEKNGLLNLP